MRAPGFSPVPFGSEAVQSKANGKPTGQISDTAFRTMSGAGHQHFLGTIRTFIADTQAEHLRKTLFCNWQYDDPLEKHSMRWDPQDDIRYALRWSNPSGDRERKQAGSMWGANRLAIKALALFPSFAAAHRLETTGLTQGRRGQLPHLTWPVWTGLLSVNCVVSLLAMAEFQKPAPDRKLSAGHGCRGGLPVRAYHPRQIPQLHACRSCLRMIRVLQWGKSTGQRAAARPGPVPLYFDCDKRRSQP